MPSPYRGRSDQPNRQEILSDRQKMDTLLRWQRAGLTAHDARRRCGMSTRVFTRLRRASPLFALRVATLDRIVKDIPPTPTPIPYGAVHPQQREKKEHARGEESIYTRKQRQRALEDLVDLEQKEAFLRIYRETGSRTEALDKLGLRAAEVEIELTTDTDFYEALTEEKKRKLWDVEDEQMERAKTSGVEARFVLKNERAPKVPKRKDLNSTAPSWADPDKMKEAQEWAEGTKGFHAEAPDGDDPPS